MQQSWKLQGATHSACMRLSPGVQWHEKLLHACRVDMLLKRFRGTHHGSMNHPTASEKDYQLGLALIRAAWQHAIAQQVPVHLPARL